MATNLVIPDIDLNNLVDDEVELNKALLHDEMLAELAEKRKDRLGKFTSSEFHKLMTSENSNELSAGAETYVMEKVCEEITGEFADDYDTPQMRRGKELEGVAINKLSDLLGVEITNTGIDQYFFEYKDHLISHCSNKLDDHIGSTPDGIINNDVLIEVKCPNTKTFINYYLKLKINNEILKKVEKKYYWQVQGQMLLSGASKVIFACYDDRIKDKDKQLFFIDVERNEEDQEKLINKLLLAVDRKVELLKLLEK